VYTHTLYNIRILPDGKAMNGKHIVTKKKKHNIYVMRTAYVIILLQRYGSRHATQLIVCIVIIIIIFYFNGHYVYNMFIKKNDKNRCTFHFGTSCIVSS